MLKDRLPQGKQRARWCWLVILQNKTKQAMTMSKCTVGKRGQSVGRRGNHFREQGFKSIPGNSWHNGWDTGQRSKVRDTGSIRFCCINTGGKWTVKKSSWGCNTSAPTTADTLTSWPHSSVWSISLVSYSWFYILVPFLFHCMVTILLHLGFYYNATFSGSLTLVFHLPNLFIAHAHSIQASFYPHKKTVALPYLTVYCVPILVI